MGNDSNNKVELVIALIGLTSCGKGTFSEFLIDMCGSEKCTHISSGGIIESEIVKRTPIGIKAEPYYKSGQNVPTKIVTEMITEARKSATPIIIEDGTLRHPDQMAHFDHAVGLHCCAKVIIVHIDTDEHVCRARASKRGRVDDAGFERKLATYQRDVLPVINHYEQHGKNRHGYRFVRIRGNEMRDDAPQLVPYVLNRGNSSHLMTRSAYHASIAA